MLKRCTVWAALAALAWGAVAAQGAETGDLGRVDQLNFGFMTTESASGLQKRFEPFCEELSEAIGLPVRVYMAPDYAGVVEAMRFGKVHLAWCGNKAALEAVRRARGEVFARTTGADGETGYSSVIITHRDAPWATVEAAIAEGADLTFGNGDRNSTSGYLVPMCYLWQPRGIDPLTHFKRVLTTNHEGNLMAVATRQVDFATNNTMDLARFQARRPDLAAKVRVLWTSPLIPRDTLVWRKDLPAELRAAIKAFVLGYGRLGPKADRQRTVLASLAQGWGPFLDADNGLLLTIQEIALTGALLEAKYADEDSEEARGRQVAALEGKLQELRRFREFAETLE